MQFDTNKSYQFGSGGHYYPQDPDNPVDADAYEVFWYYIQKLVPGVLGSLRDEILPIYNMDTLYSGLETWAKNWNLNGLPNIYKTAYYILEQWNTYPYLVGSYMSISYVTSTYSIPLPEMVTYTYRQWMPEWETEKEYIQEIITEFEKQLNENLEQIKLLISESGMIPAPCKRNMLHFEWVVRFQVMNWNYKKIADTYSKGRENPLSEDTISKAIINVAELIHLNLRPHDKGGRPKNIKM